MPFAPVVMTGSHQDSVRNAGKYDGLFGILSPIACVRELHRQGKRLPYTLEVVGFGDEEGVRFPATLVGSRAMAGQFDPAGWNAPTPAASACGKRSLTSAATLTRGNRSIVAMVSTVTWWRLSSRISSRGQCC